MVDPYSQWGRARDFFLAALKSLRGVTMQSMDEIEATCYQNELSRAEAYENGLEEVCGNCWNHVDGVCKCSGNEEPDDQPACSFFEP